jgi:hypothetical protein
MDTLLVMTVASFVAGIAIGNFAQEVCGELREFSEAEGELLILLTFLIFGASGRRPTLTPDASPSRQEAP